MKPANKKKLIIYGLCAAIIILIIIAIKLNTINNSEKTKKDNYMTNANDIINNIYLFDNGKRITDSSVIMTWKNNNANEPNPSDICVNGICSVSKYIFPVTFFKTTKNNILTDCQWKQQYLEYHVNFKEVDYSDYNNMLKKLTETAIKQKQFNPYQKNADSYKNIKNEINYSFDITTGDFKIIKPDQINLEKKIFRNNTCQLDDFFNKHGIIWGQ